MSHCSLFSIVRGFFSLLLGPEIETFIDFPSDIPHDVQCHVVLYFHNYDLHTGQFTRNY